MAKNLSVFVCQACGGQAPKWMGKCPDCGEWNTLAEEKVEKASNKPLRGSLAKNDAPVVQSITSITGFDQKRISTGISEFDRTLGGGLVMGSLVLVGGDPGIGKSTLILQTLWQMASTGIKALYVSGEESPQQVKLRAERLNALSDNLEVCSEICIEEVIRILDKTRPAVIVLDSIQTFYTNDLQSAPGSIGQVKEVAFKIFQEAKKRSLPVFLIGHITKDGAIAGPKSLEHIVDTVIYFEGDKGHSYRILRATKNRFGPTPEIGVFEMMPEGLVPVDNPSEIFLSERPVESPGSAITASMEGSRPLLVEVQALVCASTTVGMPRRMSTGMDPNRTTLLIAIMEKRLDLQLQREDIYANVAGGIKISEPATDMAVAAAIASGFQNRVIDSKTVLIGEIGLTGEVRSVAQLEPRIAEAANLGFNRCIVPFSAKKLKSLPKKDIDIQFVKTLAQAFEIIF
ncbi:MAG: DNA repair protein RadA [Nitrospinales bacterium]